MRADPRESVSEITEIGDSEPGDGLFAFLNAVWWGSLAGSGAFLLFTLPIGILAMFDGESEGLFLGLAPLVIAGAGTLAGMILVGLPLTALLHHLGREQSANYAGMGALAGFFLPALFLLVTTGAEPLLLPAGLFLGLFGMISGGVSAILWGEYRQSQASREAARDECSGAGADQPANPFHDMIH